MTDKLRDFVSTCRPPRQSEPFFGYLKIESPYKTKKSRNVKSKAIYLKVGKLAELGHCYVTIANRLGLTKKQVKNARVYYANRCAGI